jgi:hypothetical protein
MPRDFSPQDFDDSGLPSLDDRSAGESCGANRDPTDSASPAPQRSKRSQEDRFREIHFIAGQTVLYDRDRGYRLRESAIRTLTELGKFRVIAPHDLIRHIYTGRQKDADRDMQRLVRQGLVSKGIFEGPEATPRELLTLTRQGYRLLRSSHLVAEEQAIYHGFARSKEANHDADLYRMYQKESARIEIEGGRGLRIILDYELKQKINRDIARFGSAARQEIAERHGLRVVCNRIPVPDLRIEYETSDGGMARVDLDLVTENYRGRTVAEKVHAGFSLYAAHGEAGHLRRVLDQHQLIADILSL